MRKKIILLIMSLSIFIGIGYLILKIFEVNILIPMVAGAVVFFFIAKKNIK